MGNSPSEYRNPEEPAFDCRFVLLLLKVCQKVCYCFSVFLSHHFRKVQNFSYFSLVNYKQNKQGNPQTKTKPNPASPSVLLLKRSWVVSVQEAQGAYLGLHSFPVYSLLSSLPGEA